MAKQTKQMSMEDFLRSQIEELQKEKEKLKTEKNKAEGEKYVLDVELQNALENIEFVTSEKQSSDAQKQQYRQENVSLKETISDLNHRIEKLSTEGFHEKTSAQKTGVGKRHLQHFAQEDMTDDCQEDRCNTVQIKQELAEKEKEISRLARKLNDVKKKLESVCTPERQVEQEKKKNKGQNDYLQMKIAGLKEKSEELKKTITEQEGCVHSKQMEVNQLQLEVKKWKRLHDDLLRKISVSEKSAEMRVNSLQEAHDTRMRQMAEEHRQFVEKHFKKYKKTEQDRQTRIQAFLQRLNNAEHRVTRDTMVAFLLTLSLPQPSEDGQSRAQSTVQIQELSDDE